MHMRLAVVCDMRVAYAACVRFLRLRTFWPIEDLPSAALPPAGDFINYRI